MHLSIFIIFHLSIEHLQIESTPGKKKIYLFYLKLFMILLVVADILSDILNGIGEGNFFKKKKYILISILLIFSFY